MHLSLYREEVRMTQDKTDKRYYCEICKNTGYVTSPHDIPVCCDQPMNELPREQCTDVHPEMARNDDASEPCDDGRGQTYYKDIDS